MMRGAVLAGGDSRRMGSDKSGIVFQGEPLWRRQMRVLREAGAEPVMLVRRPGQSVPAGVACVRDSAVDSGPMAGLQAALAAAGSAPFTAVLKPWTCRGSIPPGSNGCSGSCRAGQGAMARHGDICEPLAAIYPTEALLEVTTRLERRDLSLQRLARALAAAGHMTLLPLSAAAAAQTVSVNTAEELKAAQKGP